MYSSKSSEFIFSGFFPILPFFYSLVSVSWVLLVLNLISWYFILQLSRHLINFIISFFQLTSELCLTSQSWPKNMSILFKSTTTASICSLYLLILISRGVTLVISPFFVLSMLKTSNEKFISFVCILFSLTSYSSISICMHPEFTSALTLRFLLFFIFMFAYMFNSLSTLLSVWNNIFILRTYKGDLSYHAYLKSSPKPYFFFPFHHCSYCLILLESSIFLSIVSLYNLWQCALLYYI